VEICKNYDNSEEVIMALNTVKEIVDMIIEHEENTKEEIKKKENYTTSINEYTRLSLS